MSHGLQFSTEDIIKALDETHGGVYLAAERLGCSHKTIERRAKNVQSVQDVIDKYSGRRVDVGELALDIALANKEAWAIQFILRTKGKNRGYTERQEIAGADGNAIKILVEYVSNSDETAEHD